MQRLESLVKKSSILVFILLYCWGCAAPGPGGKGAKTEAQPEGQVTGEAKPAQSPGAPKRTDQLLGIQIQDQGEDTIVYLAGNGPFQDYQFRRLGEDRFALELSDLKGESNLPSLPTASERVKLMYADVKFSEGVQIIGTLKTVLDHYVLSNSQNDLILTLSFSKEPLPSLKEPSSAQAPEKSASISKEKPKKGKSNPPVSAKSQKAAAKSKGVPGDVALNPPPVAPTDKLSVPEFQAATGLPKKQYSGKPISLDLLDADVRNVLRLLSDITGSNIVIEPDVAGRVTLKVERVPWDQVLDMVLSMNDLGKEQIGNVIRVAKQGKLKQEYDHAKADIKARQELNEVAKEVGDLSTVYLTINYAKPEDIKNKLSEAKSERGKLSVDDRTSLIIYTDYPYYIENARKLLARLDRATPQVLIEARIVTLTDNVTRNLGFNWNLTTKNAGDVHPANIRDFAVAVPQDPFFSFTLAEVIGNTLTRVDAALTALETSSQGSLLAAPRVLTLNHVKAVITQGTQIPYLKLSDLNVASTEFKDATLELQVTPHITPDHKVRLEIQAKQDVPGAPVSTIQGTAVPGIDTRKITTELLVDDGNTVVIGGVIQNTETLSRTATPWFHKIPILGFFFKSDSKTSNKQELLIFISPRIIEASGPPSRG